MSQRSYVEIFLDMPVIWTDFENLVSPSNKIYIRNINFLSVRTKFCQSNPSFWHFSRSLCHVVYLKHSFVTSWENVLFTLEDIGTFVKITWNYFPCLVLHNVTVFIDYAQGLVQLLLLIFTSMISFLHCLSELLKDGKAVNYNGSKIIGLIHLKFGKGWLVRIIFLTWMRYFPEKQGKGQQRGTYPDLFNLAAE